ncbi:GlsB/YeaQ/YmgE family stress response membrane protein [Spirosoma gilvum]
MQLLITLLVGAVAGWLADLVFKRFSLSLLVEIILGIVGAFVGGWLFGTALGADTGILGRILTAFVGACIVLGIAALIKGSRRTI